MAISAKRSLRVVVIGLLLMLVGLWGIAAGSFVMWHSRPLHVGLGAAPWWVYFLHYSYLTAPAAGLVLVIAAVEFLLLHAWGRSVLETLLWLYLAFVFVVFPAVWLLMYSRIFASVEGRPFGIGTFTLVWAVSAIVSAAICLPLLMLLRGRTVRESMRTRRGSWKSTVLTVGAVLAVSAVVTLSTRWMSASIRQQQAREEVQAIKERLRGMPPLSQEELQDHLRRALADGHTELVALLLEGGADPASEPQQWFYPLHDAARMGRGEIVDLLLEHGASVDAQYDHGATPLFVAVEAGQFGVARQLLAHGADPNLGEEDGRTPLHEASRQGSAETVRLLLAAGARVDAVTSGGGTPLLLAAGSGCADCVRQLLEAGANPRAKTSYGTTPLHFAAGSGSVEALRALIEAGAEINAADEYGETPLHSAVSMGQENAARLLLEHGASVNARRLAGSTALHVAAAGGYSEIAKLIVEKGGDPGVRDTSGRTPAELAESEGHRRLAAWLRSRQAE